MSDGIYRSVFPFQQFISTERMPVRASTRVRATNEKEKEKEKREERKERFHVSPQCVTGDRRREDAEETRASKKS